MAKKILCFSVILLSLTLSSCFLDLGNETIALGNCEKEYNNSLTLLTSGCNYIDVPEGKTLYTLTVNIPDKYGEGSAQSVRISGTNFKGVSKSLIPSNPKNEAELKTTRTDVYICEGGWGPREVGYLGENGPNRILYYIETNSLKQSEEAFEYTAKDGSAGSICVDYKKVIQKLNEKLSYNVLGKERSLYNMDMYDVDKTTYFHVVFNNFGMDSAHYTPTETSPGASGTSGAYVPDYLRGYNKADMFFVNTRFIDIMIKDWTGFLRTTYTDGYLKEKGLDTDGLYDYAVSTIFGVFVHEYFHCLMDSYLNFNTEGKVLSDGPLFWIEGMAESASYLVRGSRTAEHSGFVKEWLSDTAAYKIRLNKGESKDCIDYAVAPMFFLFIKEKYGMDMLKKFAKYTNPNDDLNTIVCNCTGRSFGSLYREFIISVFSSIYGNSGKLGFLKDWSMTKENLAEWCPSDSGAYELDSGCFSLTRWEQNPTELNVQTDCDCYAFFL